MESSNKALVLADGDGNLYAVAVETILNGRIPAEQRAAVEQAIVTTQPEVHGYGKPDEPKPPKDPRFSSIDFCTVGLVSLAGNNAQIGLLLPAVVPAAGGGGSGRF